MTRRSLLNTLSSDELSLSQVWGWYEFQRALIGEEKSRVLHTLSEGEGLAMSRYFGKTRAELDVDFAFQTTELAQLAMFAMLSCTEAALRVDFIGRVHNKDKDSLSRRFWRTFRRRGFQKIRFEEDILDAWCEDDAAARIVRAISHFKGALNLRNWLAHGRYWKPKLGRAAGYTPVDVFDICRELLEATDLLPVENMGM
jgi:hypothetical protein